MDNKTKIAICDAFGDWLAGPTGGSPCSPNASEATCPVNDEMGGFSFVLSLQAMAEMAEVLGYSNATQRYQRLADAATAEFHRLFFNTTVQRYGGDLNAVQSLSLPALEIGSPPTPALRDSVVQTLEYDLAHRTNYTLRVGAVTSKVSVDKHFIVGSSSRGKQYISSDLPVRLLVEF